VLEAATRNATGIGIYLVEAFFNGKFRQFHFGIYRQTALIV
jgi:hypothetical protein